ncbi:MAG: hypothetical protein JSR33_05725, partial [Proteobacteria bacterium]|nr:hypothetical protein [Pseudomonadota bacterium]
MSKQQMIISILESVILDPAVLAELKQHQLQDEAGVQKFILAVNSALRQEIRHVFNDWGFANNLGISTLCCNGLIAVIDACFSIHTQSETTQNVIRITAFLLTGCSVWLHHLRRQFVREHLGLVSKTLLHFYAAPSMMLWRQCQTQQDIVQCLEDWQFDHNIVAQLKTNRMNLTSKPRQNLAKKDSFLKTSLTVRSQFQEHIRLTGEETYLSSFLAGAFLALSGSALLDRISRHGISWESILLLGGITFYYYQVHRLYTRNLSVSHALAEWDIQAIDHGLAVLSMNIRQKEAKLSRLPLLVIDKPSEARSSVHPTVQNQNLTKKKRLSKTRTCTMRLKQTVSRLGHVAASMPVWGYQFMATLLRSVLIPASKTFSVEEAFQEIMAVGDQPAQRPPEVPRKKISKPLPRKKIKRPVRATPQPPLNPGPVNSEESKIIPVISDQFPSASESTLVPVLASASDHLNETLPEPAPSTSSDIVKEPEESKLLHTVSNQSGSESAVISVFAPEPVSPSLDEEKWSVTLFHQPPPKPEPSQLIFSPEEEKALLIKRVQLAEQAFRIQQGRALSAEAYVGYLQSQLARVAYTAHYWQWQATSLWGRLFSAPPP